MEQFIRNSRAGLAPADHWKIRKKLFFLKTNDYKGIKCAKCFDGAVGAAPYIAYLRNYSINYNLTAYYAKSRPFGLHFYVLV